mgnify:CR=1 FL=1
MYIISVNEVLLTFAKTKEYVSVIYFTHLLLLDVVWKKKKKEKEKEKGGVRYNVLIY